MKIFLDTAATAVIERWDKTQLIDGVTTNPTHLSKEGDNPMQVVTKICELLPYGDISVEVTQSEPHAVYEQAKKIAKIAKNVLVKIPCHTDYYPTIAQLAQEGIPLNITLVFSVSQALCMSKLGVAYISPFIGRLDDSGADGIAVLQDICRMREWYGYGSAILAASIRTVEKAEAALLTGADALTVPPAVLEAMTKHVLTDVGMAQFASDWKKLGVRQFP